MHPSEIFFQPNAQNQTCPVLAFFPAKCSNENLSSPLAQIHDFFGNTGTTIKITKAAVSPTVHGACALQYTRRLSCWSHVCCTTPDSVNCTLHHPLTRPRWITTCDRRCNRRCFRPFRVSSPARATTRIRRKVIQHTPGTKFPNRFSQKQGGGHTRN